MYGSIFHDRIQQLNNEKARLHAVVPKNVASFFVRPPQKTTVLPVALHNTNILIRVRGSTELKILCKPTRREETGMHKGFILLIALVYALGVPVAAMAAD